MRKGLWPSPLFLVGNASPVVSERNLCNHPSHSRKCGRPVVASFDWCDHRAWPGRVRQATAHLYKHSCACECSC
jgi:hypothetical protein